MPPNRIESSSTVSRGTIRPSAPSNRSSPHHVQNCQQILGIVTKIQYRRRRRVVGRKVRGGTRWVPQWDQYNRTRARTLPLGNRCTGISKALPLISGRAHAITAIDHWIAPPGSWTDCRCKSGNRCSMTNASRPINPAAKSRPPPATAFGIRHVLRAGSAWRMLPHDLLPWQRVCNYFRVWRQKGVWQAIHDALWPPSPACPEAPVQSLGDDPQQPRCGPANLSRPWPLPVLDTAWDRANRYPPRCSVPTVNVP